MPIILFFAFSGAVFWGLVIGVVLCFRVDFTIGDKTYHHVDRFYNPDWD